ncbi:hypothetical protein I4U23_020633 [Adineta vaga]|nr:hypothetical protein I4U23_020633 [Adineta vaga]
MDDDLSCCSAYFYSRYTDEDTLIDLSMMNYPNLEKKDDYLLSNTDQSFRIRFLSFIQYDSLCFRIFVGIIFLLMFLLIAVYFYKYQYIQATLADQSIETSSIKL